MIEQIERALRDILPLINEWYRRVLGLPSQASVYARDVDVLHYFEITAFTLIGIAFMGAVIWSLFRFRRKGPPTRTARISMPSLVLAYAIAVLILFTVFWVFSFRQYVTVAAAPPGAMPIYVTAKQWMWKFAYPQGVTSANILYLPVGRPVQFVMASRDVIHSFYLPDFRVKQDIVPGTYTLLTITPDRPGTYPLRCAELCGVGHSEMLGTIVVLDAAAFDSWLDGERRLLSTSSTAAPSAGPTDLSTLGARYAAQHGCLHCHTTDGRPHIGPSWAGMFGHEEAMQDGARVLVDPTYITQSMMEPAVRVVEGFAPVMPSFQGEITPPETAAIIEYMRSLRDVPRRTDPVISITPVTPVIRPPQP